MKELAVMADESTAQGDGQGASDGASTVDNTADQQDNRPDGRGDVPPEVRRALNKANKEAEGLRRQLKEIEDRDKTETQKAAERAEAAERAAADSTAKLMRYEVAAEKNLPSTWISRLQGSTADELRADADELLKLLPGAGAAGGSFDGGTRRPAPKPDDMNSLIRRTAGRG